MKKTIVALAALTTLAGAAPAAAQSSLPMGTAKHISRVYAQGRWNAPGWSEAHGLGWDNEDTTTDCVRWSRARIDCIVSLDIQSYGYDGYGYAWCVGNVSVTKDRYMLHARTYDLTCDASE